MGESVRTVIRSRGATLRPGDVVALNNPYNGGTHLPDVTVITPVFDEDGKEILFFVGSRGHHADIGGLTPGSTPPDSRVLEEEGVVIDDFLLVEQGRFREAEFRALLGAAKYPARSPDVNVADIKAQVAANETGVQELRRAVREHGLGTVRAYMRHVMDNAEEACAACSTDWATGPSPTPWTTARPCASRCGWTGRHGARWWTSPAPGSSAATTSTRRRR